MSCGIAKPVIENAHCVHTCLANWQRYWTDTIRVIKRCTLETCDEIAELVGSVSHAIYTKCIPIVLGVVSKVKLPERSREIASTEIINAINGVNA